MMKQHFSSILFSILAIVLGYMIGGFHGAWVVAILGVLEISLSFDNAVVNASILKNWSALWRHRFLTWGMPVAVFGMRLVFPLLIVAIIAQINPINALILALKNPQQYAHILSQAHNQIAAYGGSFLFMIFLKYFLNAEKDVHWIQPVEAPLTKLGKLEAIQCALVLVFVVGASHLLEASHQLSFVVAGICGIVTYILADAFGSFVGGEEESEEKTQGPSRIIKEGLMGLLYLELLDASFSFDGVMGAFAISNHIFLITLGLGIGAMFVRSMTLQLVEKGTLSEYPFLEHGAFWAIGALATITFMSIKYEIPEVVSGLLGAGFIGVSFVSSVLENKKQQQINS